MITREPARARNPVLCGTLSGQRTEAFMAAKPIRTLATSSVALAIALAASSASAQTVVTRSIAAEPVETTITQTPAGTVVTRRPVDAPVARSAAPAIVQPAMPATTVIETVPNTIDAITTREVVRRAEATRAAPALVTRQVSARPERHVTRAKVVRRTTVRTTTARAAPRRRRAPTATPGLAGALTWSSRQPEWSSRM